MPNKGTLQFKRRERNFFNKLALESSGHSVNSGETISRITTHVSKYLRNEGKLEGLILDAGCGNGELSKGLARLGYSVIGVDISPKMVQEANLNPVHGFTAIEEDIERPDLFKPASLDSILCCAILHHFPSIQASCLLENFSCWLKPGGLVFVWEPNGSNPMIKMPNMLGRKFRNFLFSEHISPNEVVHTFPTYKKAFKEAGFTLVDVNVWTNKSVGLYHGLLAFWTLTKEFLLSISRVLPFPYGGSALFMIFKGAKHNED